MKLYRLQFVLREPSEDTEEKYLAEIPDLPGCRALGDTAPRRWRTFRVSPRRS
jgi:hypothetical protein